MSDQYAVIGHPISHSKSPWIHAEFAQQLNEDINYALMDSAPDAFNTTVRSFIEKGAKGLNVTVPFKQDAWSLADELSEHARLAGAVNTLSFNPDGTIRGDNTDGVGLVSDLTKNQGMNLSGKRVLILGAGGAVRGVLQPLLEQNVSQIHIVNRTVQKAQDLLELFKHYSNISVSGYDTLADAGEFDLIINGTASSLTGDLPPLCKAVLADNCHAYDMMYASQKTVFEIWCSENGAGSVHNGLGMLVEQAAESFWIWRGVRPDTSPVLAALTEQLSGE